MSSSPPPLPPPPPQPRPQVYSPDGRWIWTGAAWEPAVPPQRHDLFWFFQSSGWIEAVLLMGLINLIPIVGLMVVFGWLLESRDSIRKGAWVVPPAGFRYLDRGVGPVLVYLIYGLIVGAIIAFLFVMAIVLAAAQAPGAVVALLFLVASAALLGAILAYYYVFAALVTVSDSRGIGPACNPDRLWRTSVANGSEPWKVAGAVVLGGLVAGLIPFVGFLFAPAAYLMAAPYLARFDETRRGPAGT